MFTMCEAWVHGVFLISKELYALTIKNENLVFIWFEICFKFKHEGRPRMQVSELTTDNCLKLKQIVV